MENSVQPLVMFRHHRARTFSVIGYCDAQSGYLPDLWAVNNPIRSEYQLLMRGPPQEPFVHFQGSRLSALPWQINLPPTVPRQPGYLLLCTELYPQHAPAQAGPNNLHRARLLKIRVFASSCATPSPEAICSSALYTSSRISRRSCILSYS